MIYEQLPNRELACLSRGLFLPPPYLVGEAGGGFAKTRGFHTHLIPSAQRLIWAAKQPLGNAALGALLA